MTTRPAPQSAILPAAKPAALYLILRLGDRGRDAASVATVLRTVPALVDELGARDQDAQLAATVGIGAELWDVLSPGRRPTGLRSFRALAAGGRKAPSTGGDVLLHVTSQRHDVNLDLALTVRRRLGARVETLEEVVGFRYHDSRDLTGFIDGTENPQDDERAEWALVGDEDAPFAGGSYVFTQRYVHDLVTWSTLSVAEQEDVIGRRKPDSEELPDDRKPATAHIARSNLVADGEELKIVRHSLPYGTSSEHGLFFIAYCRTLDIPEQMLARMMGTAGDGLHDRLMEFSHAVSGAHFFAPSLPALWQLGAR